MYMCIVKEKYSIVVDLIKDVELKFEMKLRGFWRISESHTYH
jgi:hypothetical protein